MTSTSLFVLGGARSGKSRYAQHHAEAIDGRHVYIATAEAWDDEMRDRIARHRADRDARWETVDAPRELAAAIDEQSGSGSVVLVDCLTFWLTNVMLADEEIEAATETLCASIARFDGHIILVSNEVGLSIVPDNALARRFRDAAGRVNQAVAAAAQEVMFIAAGLPMRLKRP